MRVIRDEINGVTYVDRGEGGPIAALADHGDALTWQWREPAFGDVVHDSTIDPETLVAARDVRDDLIKRVAESKIAATAKADVRKIIDEVLPEAE